MSSGPRDQIFISYSHRDAQWLKKLQTTLKPLSRAGKINLWDDTSIQAGQKWRTQISTALSRAKVAVLLVSQDFLASDFIAAHELPPILTAAQAEGLIVVWVPVTASLYDVTEIADYQAAHDPARPLDSLEPAALNEALVKIARAIQDAMQR